VDRFSHLVSMVFHPLWMPLMIYAFIRGLDPFMISGTPLDYFILLILVINSVAPALSMLIMMRYGMLSGLEMHRREERLRPYLLVLFYYCISFLLLWWKDPGLPAELLRFFPAVILSLTAATVINLRWKISMHMLAQGGATGVLLAIRSAVPLDLSGPLILLLLIAACVGVARLHLQAHTHAQVYAGYLLGLVTNWLVISL
jgi:hypothetical protein